MTELYTDINKITADLQLKAEKDLSNISDSAKSMLSGIGMPSENYVDLTVGASGATYTAPANGWLTWYCNVLGNGYIFVQNNSSGILPSRDASSNLDMAGFIPAKNGDSIYVEYSNLSLNRLRFIYAEGENE